MKGLWTVQGPFPTEPLTKRWRAEFQPYGRTGYQAGTGWASTEKKARDKAMRRARLKNTTRTRR
jgi:hypothetical protein